MYSSSTLERAQGVLRKNVKLDVILGLSLKQLMGIKVPSSSQLYLANNSPSIICNVLPCSGLLVWIVIFNLIDNEQLIIICIPYLGCVAQMSKYQCTRQFAY